MITDSFVDQLKDYVEIITVCPEVEIGLGVPRAPIRVLKISNDYVLYQPETKRDLTKEMTEYCKNFVEKTTEIDGFILKNRSPSCGVGDVKIYSDYSETLLPKRESGFFGRIVRDNFHSSVVEDEGRLRNLKIREDFLIKLFAFANFRKVRNEKNMGSLVEYHSHHKLLFQAYNQYRYRLCGKIVGNLEKLSIEQVLSDYEKELSKLLSGHIKIGSMINSLQHAFGGVSEDLKVEERKYFLDSLDEYRDERIALSVITHLLMSYAVRFEKEYLAKQVLLNPFPLELTTASRTGRDSNIS